MTQQAHDPAAKHPDGPQHDLNPHANAGINHGAAGPKPGKNSVRMASDVKAAHALLKEMTNDELARIPILDAGSRLEQDATYIDLADPDHKEFTASHGMEAGPDSMIVPKTEVDYQLWNRLRGVTDPARTGGTSGT